MAVQLQESVLPAVIPRRLPRLPARKRAWPSQGEWTYEDYERLPDDGLRYEIIGGVLYMTPAPGFDHQYIVGELFTALRTFIREHQLGIVLVAPFEVRLPDVAQVVQPDLLFIAAGREPSPGDHAFTGAPDLVVEILSPSTTRTDRVVKFSAYERAGVREYWLVNPLARSVEAYTLSEDGIYELHGEFIAGSTVTSRVLSGLAFPVNDLFPTE